MEDQPTSSQEIAAWIRQRIRNGRFVPGQRLVEIDLIRQTGSSRTRVREALQRLEGEGLIQIEEFRGASVRHMSIGEVRQIYRARMALEGMAAHEFAAGASAAQLAELQSLQERLDQCVADRAAEQFGRLNNEWHRMVVEGSANLVLGDHLRRLNVPIHRLLFESFYDQRRLRIANADHQNMLGLFLARDAEGAERAMREHVWNGFQTLELIEDEFYS